MNPRLRLKVVAKVIAALLLVFIMAACGDSDTANEGGEKTIGASTTE